MLPVCLWLHFALSLLLAFSTSTFITSVFPDSLCRHLNKMCLPISSSFTLSDLSHVLPTSCSSRSFPPEFSFYLTCFFNLVSGALYPPKLSPRKSQTLCASFFLQLGSDFFSYPTASSPFASYLHFFLASSLLPQPTLCFPFFKYTPHLQILLPHFSIPRLILICISQHIKTRCSLSSLSLGEAVILLSTWQQYRRTWY